MKWSWPNFKLRVYAWWEGYNADELLALLEQAANATSSSRVREKALAIPPLAPWESPRIRIMQLVWGAGYHAPGGPEHILSLTKPFGLDPSKSTMEFGAGLGGGARTLSHEFGVWVTGYEEDVELAHAGKELSVLAGLDRKAEMQRYVVDDFELSPNKFDCIVSREALFACRNKYDVLAKLQRGLKARGQLSMTDFVLAPGVSPQDERLSAIHTHSVEFWQPEQYERRFRELNLDLRVTEDITDKYRQMILAGWANFAQGDELTVATARAYPDAVAAELDLWTSRLKALEAGLLKVVRFYVINKSEAKLMSDW